MALIKNIKVAILATDGFEQSELQDPKKALDEAGAKTTVISLQKGKIKGWKGKNWGEEVNVDKTLSEVRPDEFDALLLPGGVMNPDTLRTKAEAIEFIKHFVKTHKPIAAICHGPWTLINAEGVKGKTLTSYPSIKIDLTNAGANWVDKEVCIDNNIVTSRNPGDIPAFNKAFIELLAHSHVAL